MVTYLYNNYFVSFVILITFFLFFECLESKKVWQRLEDCEVLQLDYKD